MKKNHQRGNSFQLYCPRLKRQSPPQAFSENHARISEYLFTKHFRVATSDTLLLHVLTAQVEIYK